MIDWQEFEQLIKDLKESEEKKAAAAAAADSGGGSIIPGAGDGNTFLYLSIAAADILFLASWLSFFPNIGLFSPQYFPILA